MKWCCGPGHRKSKSPGRRTLGPGKVPVPRAMDGAQLSPTQEHSLCRTELQMWEQGAHAFKRG